MSAGYSFYLLTCPRRPEWEAAQARIAELEAEVERRIRERDEWKAEAHRLGVVARDGRAAVERLSRRPDLTPEQCAAIMPSVERLASIVGTFRPDTRESYQDFAAMLAALRAAAEPTPNEEPE